MVEAGAPRRLDGRHDAAGRAGEDGVLALEQVCGGQPARGLHEHQAGSIDGVAASQLPRHAVDIAAEDRREIGVDHGGVAAADQLDQRRDLVADRDLREAHVAGKRRNLSLVVGIAPGMHEDDGDRADAGVPGRLELRAHGRKLGRRLDRAVGAHALGNFSDALVEHFRLDDLLGEDLGPRLVADLEGVAEAAGDEESRAVALALEQRVGGDRGAHLHRGDQAGRDRRPVCDPDQAADAGNCRIGIGLPVLGEELGDPDLTVRGARHHVGEGAAAVDPEVPLARLHGARAAPSCCARHDWHVRHACLKARDAISL